MNRKLFLPPYTPVDGKDVRMNSSIFRNAHRMIDPMYWTGRDWFECGHSLGDDESGGWRSPPYKSFSWTARHRQSWWTWDRGGVEDNHFSTLIVDDETRGMRTPSNWGSAG